jgi:hypothetical protein
MTNNKKIIIGLVMVLILVMSVSTASAGFTKIKIKCGIFKKCPTPTPTPVRTPIITPIPTTLPTPLPVTPLPTTPTPTPIISGDISITSSSPDTTPEQSPFVVNTILKSTFTGSKTGSLVVLVTGLAGQTSFKRYEREIVVKPGTNAETVLIDITGWGYGDYNILVTFPVQESETSSKNNMYEFDMRIPLPSTPTPTPTPVPIPAPIPFDVSVSGRVSSQTVTTLDIMTTVAHNSGKTIEGHVAVTVNGVTQSKKIVMKHHDTYISDEDTPFSFDISSWNAGNYPVVVSFPTRNNEPNTANNVYQFNVIIPPKPPAPKNVDLDLSRLNIITQCCSPYVKYGMYFGISYSIVNRGDDASGVFTIETEGTTFYKNTITLKKGETKSEVITLLSSQLPYRPQVNGYNYLLEGKITTPGDMNSKNDKMNVELGMKG